MNDTTRGEPSGTTGIPYRAISMLMRKRSISLFIGAAASRIGARSAALPDGKQLARDFVALSNYPGHDEDPLTKISQYLVETAGDRDLILDYIQTTFHEKIDPQYNCALTEFLCALAAECIPKLIVSTNYDTLVERVLEARSIDYICVSHILGKSKYTGRLVVYTDSTASIDERNIMTRQDLDEMLEDRLEASSPPVILYKMHGSALAYVSLERRQEIGLDNVDSIVVTEQDYIDFLDRNLMNRIPIHLQRMLHRARFLFLGYSLADWNFRLLLHRLRENQKGGDLKHWACLFTPDPVESGFWQRRGVNIYYISLDKFLADLSRNLAEVAT
jgi:hypothetical protein